jgi:hypothetical protein
MQNHYLVLSLPNALRRSICGVVKRDCQRNALAIADAWSHNYRLGALQKTMATGFKIAKRVK